MIPLQGVCCANFLDAGWSSVQSLLGFLFGLRQLLLSLEPNDPLDIEVAKMMNDDPDQFILKATEWAVRYAEAPRRILTIVSNSVKPISQRKAPESSKYVDLVLLS